MAFNYLSGLAANLLTSVIAVSSEDANFPKTNLRTGWPAQPFKFATAALNDYMNFSLTAPTEITLIGIFGHNIDSGITSIDILSDDNGGMTSPVTEVNIPFASLTSPTHYEILASPTNHQHWRIRFNGTNGSPIEIGEVVMGIKSTLTDPQLDSWNFEELMPQNRQIGKNIPQVFAINLANYRQRRISLSFSTTTYAARDELTDMMIDSKFGEEPLIFVPDPDDVIIIHGRMPASLNWKRSGAAATGGRHQVSFTIEEDPFWLTLP